MSAARAAVVAVATSLASCAASPAPQRPAATPPPAENAAPARGPSAVSLRIGALFERGMHLGDEAALAEAFREMRAVARPDERPLVDRVERLVRDLHAEDDLDGLVRVTAAALTDLERVAPDPEARLAIAEQAYRLALVAAGEPSGVDADRIALGASERLVRDLPDDPRAWAVRAQALRRVAEDLRGALLAARRCSAAHPPCAELVWHLVRAIEAPRCAGAQLRPGLAIHRGTREAAHARAPRAVTAGSAPMWIADAPAITGDDVAEIVGDGATLLVALRPEAAAALEGFRTQVAAVDAAAVVMVEGRVVGAAERLVPMMRGKLLLGSDPAAPLDLGAVCAQIVRQRAPD